MSAAVAIRSLFQHRAYPTSKRSWTRWSKFLRKRPKSLPSNRSEVSSERLVVPQVDLALLTNLLLTLDWDCFWRGSTRDGIYGPAVNLLQTGNTVTLASSVTKPKHCWSGERIVTSHCCRLRSFLRRRFSERNHSRQRCGLRLDLDNIPFLTLWAENQALRHVKR